MSNLNNILQDLDDLNDFDDDNQSDDHSEDEINNNKQSSIDNMMNDLNDEDDEENDDDDYNMQDKESHELIKIVSAKLSSSIGQFRKSNKYINHMNQIKQAMDTNTTNTITNNNSKAIESLSSLQSNQEYNLILECNRFISEIDDEIAETYRYITQEYSKKFPELESLITNKYDYIKTILRIGNEIDLSLVELNDILPSSLVMVVSVASSTTSGKPLPNENLNIIIKACNEVLSLYNDKMFILSYIESKMTVLAPNLCAFIGSRISAQLLGKLRSMYTLYCILYYTIV